MLDPTNDKIIEMIMAKQFEFVYHNCEPLEINRKQFS